MSEGLRPGRRLLAAVLLSAVVGLVAGAGSAWAIYQHFGPASRVITEPKGGGGGGVTIGAIADAAAPSLVTVARRPVSGSELTAGTAAAELAEGSIVSPDGLVLTTLTAVSGATRPRILTADGHGYDATIAATDPLHGLVVLRAVNASGLPALGFAGAAPHVGDVAVAVSRPPLGTLSVGSGAVSAVGLQAATGDVLVPQLSGLISVDATPEPRAEGAPLLDSNGAIVGVITSLPPVAAISGLTALSGSAAATLAAHAGQGQRPAAATLGMVAVPLDAATAAAAGLPPGALVVSVQPDGPAASAKPGVQVGDVVISVNGTPVDASHPYADLVAPVTPQQSVNLVISRSGQELILRITAGTL